MLHQPECADHPRGCGENDPDAVGTAAKPGSPPRMRGKRDTVFSVGGGERITPADAGKTCIAGCSRNRNADHPRGCGENGLDRRRDPSGIGSPPRMRGKQRQVAEHLRAERITPADAGKTGYKFLHRKRCQDHPRGCGENVAAKLLNPELLGSPPRMRGKLNHASARRDAAGITPADAGKTALP